MSAIPKEFLNKTAALPDDATRPFPNSRKIFVPGSRPDLKVGMREITLTPTATSQGAEDNPPITVYDTSGPYTDPNATIDLRAGLAPLRARWIAERNDTEQLAGPSSEYGRARARPEARQPALRAYSPAAPRPARCQCLADALRPPWHRHAGDGIRRHPRDPAAR